MTVNLLINEVGFVYGIKSLDLIKVGVAQDIAKRMHKMRLENPHGLELVFYRKVFAPFRFEKRMHEILADRAVGREWFRVSLSELRVAATSARSASDKAQRAYDKPRKFRPTSDTTEINTGEINTL